MPPRAAFVLLVLWVTSWLALSVVASPVNPCGSLANAYGPYDYRTDKDRLPIVEKAHFPPIVENLISGHRGYLGGDLDYTLRAFPNHHRALVSVMNYGLRQKTDRPKDLPRPVECYFERAIRFRPQDALNRLIYATYLNRNDRLEEALQQLKVASDLPDLLPMTRENIGLIYLENNHFDMARAMAWRNLELGTRSEALIARLMVAGQWHEPPLRPEGAQTKREP